MTCFYKKKKVYGFFYKNIFCLRVINVLSVLPLDDQNFLYQFLCSWQFFSQISILITTLIQKKEWELKTSLIERQSFFPKTNKTPEIPGIKLENER